MKKILHLLAALAPCLAFAQGINNNGGKIVSTTGAYITVTGTSGNYINATNVSDGSIDNDGTMSIAGNWTNNAANNVFINPNANGRVILNGTTAQTYGGTNATYFEKLTVNNSAGVSMSRSAQVSDSLVLTAGGVSLNSNTLTVTTAAGSAISRTSGYLVSEQTNNTGQVTWNIGATAGAHTIPFGTVAGSYIPYVLNLTAGTIGNVTVSTYPTALNNTPYPTTPTLVTHVRNSAGVDNSLNTVDRFWEINKSGASGTATMTFTATAAEVGTITNLQAQRWNLAGKGWDAATAGQSNTAVSATAPNINLYTTYTLSGNNSPLPLQLLSFTAKVTGNNKVDVNWTTASEMNNDYFTVQKSIDGINFENVGIVNGAGNSNKILNYYLQDKNPYSGTSYYRLMQTDFDGKNTVYNKVPVRINTGSSFNVNAVPVSNDELTLTVTGANGQDETITITDMLGKLYYSNSVAMQSDSYNFSVHTQRQLASGVYLVTVHDIDNHASKKIIIK
ncbi:MAG: T9SS type A sorting domain-containing protein [Bacteroidia bacterium]